MDSRLEEPRRQENELFDLIERRLFAIFYAPNEMGGKIKMENLIKGFMKN